MRSNQTRAAGGSLGQPPGKAMIDYATTPVRLP
jgi:hypothetical protein